MQINVTFRFYGELNDFLAKSFRKKAFILSLNGNPSIKETIKSLGVPHTEIDLILIKRKPIDLNYKLRNGDFISVYPVFESFDISSVSPIREKGLRGLKFLIDTHLGKLAKKLRILGFDCYYRDDHIDKETNQFLIDEKRIILTRDKDTLKDRSVTRGYFVRNQNPNDQLLEIIEIFDLKRQIKPFTRCPVCNGSIDIVSKQSIDKFLEPLTRKSYNDSFQCVECNKCLGERISSTENNEMN